MQNRRRTRGNLLWLFLLLILLLVSINLFWVWRYQSLLENYGKLAEEGRNAAVAMKYGNVAAFAEENEIDLTAYPQTLLDLMKRNPETEDFVLQYPIKKDQVSKIDLKDHVGTEEVPLLMQWDERWGYTQYAGDLMGLTGCGPTCLSMVCLYLLEDAKYSPRYIADFAEKNGYAVEDNGSAWTLMSEGGKKLGLDVTEIPLDEDRIIRNLEVGNPIICIMGPGDFTEGGHFIVMTGYTDGMIQINDPNSRANSEKLWALSEIKGQIRNLWVFR